MSIEKEVQLELSADEALGLFDWTHRHEDAAYKGLQFEHSGERVAIESLCASLEKVVDVVFSPTYTDELHAARARLASGS